MAFELEWRLKRVKRFSLDDEPKEEKSSLFPLAANRSIERIRKTSEFARLKTFGKKIRVTPWLLLSFEKNELSALRFGVTVPRKVGSAVLRNKLKRWVKSFVYTSAEFHGIGVDINFVFLPTSQNCSKLKSAEVFELFRRGLTRVRKDLRSSSAEPHRLNN